MHTNYKQILLKLDEIEAFETPRNFDKKKLKSQVLLLHKNLERQFNTSLSIDFNIQDASFFCDIVIPN